MHKIKENMANLPVPSSKGQQCRRQIHWQDVAGNWQAGSQTLPILPPLVTLLWGPSFTHAISYIQLTLMSPWERKYPPHCSESIVHKTKALTLLKSLLEIPDLGSHPRTTEPESDLPISSHDFYVHQSLRSTGQNLKWKSLVDPSQWHSLNPQRWNSVGCSVNIIPTWRPYKIFWKPGDVRWLKTKERNVFKVVFD